jgi:hypothetical protein
MPHAPECSEKATLLAEIKLTMDSILSLNNGQMAAVIRGRFEGVEALETDIRRERQRKMDLIYAYKTHVQSHGC